MEEGAGAGMAPGRSPPLHPQFQFQASAGGGGVPRRRCPRLRPQVQASAEGGGVPRRRSTRLRPKVQATEEGAGVTRRHSPPVAPETLPFNDDMLREILVRLPPQPSSLPRASAVCKRWLGIVTDTKLHRQFCAHHRKPPLLGLFQYTNQGGIVFHPVLDRPDRIPPQRFDLGRYGGRHTCSLLDCRHGCVLVYDLARNEVVVCDPITGEQRGVAVPSELRKRGHLQGAVLCAAGDHRHVHGGCRLSSYKVVLVSTGRSDNQCLACVYSLETGVWGDLISTEAPYERFCADDVPAILVGNCLHWSRGDRILEFDLDKQNLAMTMGPPCLTGILNEKRDIIQAVDGALGYAIFSDPCLQMWQRNINGHGVATWVLWKTIEMDTILKFFSSYERMLVRLLWCDEDVVLLWDERSVYIVQLKSMQSRKLNGIRSTGRRCFPFRSFFTPGAAIAGGFNEAEMLHIG